MQINRSAIEAIIFSHVNAPPPPLIICPAGLISSAPSTYAGRLSTSFGLRTLNPCFSKRSVVAFELETTPENGPDEELRHQ